MANIHWHKQNLSEKTPKEPIWKHGRAWLHLDSRCVSVEWRVGNGWPMTHLNIGGGDGNNEIRLSLSFPWIGFYSLAFSGFIPSKYFPTKHTTSYLHPSQMWDMPIERQIGYSIMDGMVHISLWENPNEWNKTDPWWWNISFEPAEIICGRNKYSKRTISESEAEVILPERAYPVKVEIFESTWKRPRWPWPRRMIRANVVADPPIPAHAGKGENSYDLDDDALYEMTCCASTPAEAVEKVAASILRDRKRYGPPSLT